MDHATLNDPRLLAELHARLDGSNEPEMLLVRDLARYYGLLARELATVQLTQEETIVLKGAVWAAAQARMGGTPFGSFVEAVAAEFRSTQGMADRRTVRGDDLVARVAAWTPAQTLAVVDACERFWALARRDGWTDVPTMLRAVGLLRDGATGAVEAHGPRP